MRLSINQEKCAGCNLCVSCMPRLFKLDSKSYKAKLKQDGKLVDSLSFNPTVEQLKEVREIVRNCATRSIKLSK